MVEEQSQSHQEQPLERGREWLEKLLQAMSVSVPVSAENDVLEIEASDLLDSEKEVLLGRNGATLDAMQYLANMLLNLHVSAEERFSYVVELDGYRRRRQAEIQQMVVTAVDQVRSTGEEHELPSLSAAERRHVHTLLATEDYVDLSTFSRGREPHRHLVVCLAPSD